MKKATPHQIFLVLSMFFGTTPEEREPLFKDRRVAALKPVQLRNELVNANVLRLGKRNRLGYVALGDEAEDFVMKHLGASLPKTDAAAPVLSTVLARLQDLLLTQGHSLAEFAGLRSSNASPASSGGKLEQSPEQAIREAYLSLTHGEKRCRVRLAELRHLVPVQDQVINEALLAMQIAGQVVLYKLDNNAEISADDERAALYIEGQPRHVVYLEA